MKNSHVIKLTYYSNVDDTESMVIHLGSLEVPCNISLADFTDIELAEELVRRNAQISFSLKASPPSSEIERYGE